MCAANMNLISNVCGKCEFDFKCSPGIHHADVLAISESLQTGELWPGNGRIRLSVFWWMEGKKKGRKGGRVCCMIY